MREVSQCTYHCGANNSCLAHVSAVLIATVTDMTGSLVAPTSGDNCLPGDIRDNLQNKENDKSRWK